MGRFYFLIWIRWTLRVFLCSFTLTFFLSFVVSLALYIKQETPPLTPDVYKALYEIAKFWFMIIWNMALLFVLFRSIKYIFNVPFNGYKFLLSDCRAQAYIEPIGYGDLVKVWRKWFMLLIWLVVVEMILATFFIYLFSSSEDIFVWFNEFWLFTFVVVAGYFSFILLPNRCKRVKVKKC